MGEIFKDVRWDTFGLLKEALHAVEAAVNLETQELARVSWDLRGMLVRLARSEGMSLRPSELSRALSTTASAITRIADEGEAVGALTREVDPRDARATQIKITPAGLELARSWGKATLECLVAHTRAPFSPNEIEKLEYMLRTMRDHAQEYCDVHSGQSEGPAH